MSGDKAYWWRALEPKRDGPTFQSETTAYYRRDGFVLRYTGKDGATEWTLTENGNPEPLGMYRFLKVSNPLILPPVSWANGEIRKLRRQRLKEQGLLPPRVRKPPKPYEDVIAEIDASPGFWRDVERLGAEKLGKLSPLERKMAHLLLKYRREKNCN